MGTSISESGLMSTHDMHFKEIIGDMMLASYKNVVLNRQNHFKPIGTGKHKKSPIQNGAAAVACLLIFITFESMVRRAYYFSQDSDKDKAHGEELWWIMKQLKPGIHKNQKIKKYLDELNLIRDIIVHAYIFEGTLKWNNDHRLTAIKEKVIAGKRKQDVGPSRLTSNLNLHKSPNQIGFSDAAKFYLSFVLLLKSVRMKEPYELWRWENDDVEPVEWLKNAFKKLGFSKSKIWKDLNETIDDEEYKEFFEGLGDIKFE